jgi:branched-subunit amino acid transport protein
MSLLSVASAGAGQMRAITIWGAASAAGAALGPLLGGLLVDLSGWQGLFWIDAVVAAACIPLTIARVQESRDLKRPKSIDFVGSALIAGILVPLVLALSEGADWGWGSVAVLGCLAVTIVSTILFVVVEGRVKAPLVDLGLLRNRLERTSEQSGHERGQKIFDDHLMAPLVAGEAIGMANVVRGVVQHGRMREACAEDEERSEKQGENARDETIRNRDSRNRGRPGRNCGLSHNNLRAAGKSKPCWRACAGSVWQVSWLTVQGPCRGMNQRIFLAFPKRLPLRVGDDS